VFWVWGKRQKKKKKKEKGKKEAPTVVEACGRNWRRAASFPRGSSYSELLKR